MAARKAWMRGGLEWEIAPPWPGAAELAARHRISPLVAQVLHNRGLDDAGAITRFLHPKLSDLHAPELLPDVDKAADRIVRAVRQHERIVIYGDYDVDGMTGVAILFRCLALHGADVDYYVPHRLEEGYGVNAEAVAKIADEGAKLLVTVDCGVSAVEPLRLAVERGMDVIVTDHHAGGEPLPPALAIVHPNLPGPGRATYPNPDLCGAGVAFKLAWMVAKRLAGRDRVDEPIRTFLLEATSLAALGTIADVVPLVGENRVLAVFGLKGLAVTAHVGIRALIESAGLTGEKLDAYHVGFCLAPRLNACGRMGHAHAAVELLTRADAERCRRIAIHLEEQNAQRQQIEREIFEQAAAQVESGQAVGCDDAAIVVAGDNWHAGVVGIVASRLVERFARPAVVIAMTNGEGQGSGRSIPGFNLRDALADCAASLTSFGGHAMAAGLRLSREHLQDFARCFVACARGHIPATSLRPVLRIDALTSLAALTVPAVQQLAALAPFGQGNPHVRLALRGCRLLNAPTRMGKSGATVSFVVTRDAQPDASAPAHGQERGRDARDTLSAPARPASPYGQGRLRCVGFKMGDLADKLVANITVDIAGAAVINEFNGRVNVEMHLDDVHW